MLIIINKWAVELKNQIIINKHSKLPLKLEFLN
jgi:hypothetical protein